jgi:hypothetical protein
MVWVSVSRQNELIRSEHLGQPVSGGDGWGVVAALSYRIRPFSRHVAPRRAAYHYRSVGTSATMML